MEMLNLNCISCGMKNLTFSNEKYSCSNCGREYMTRNGVYQFTKSAQYYSDLDKEKMNSLIQECKEIGWESAVRNRFEDNQFLFRIITDETRADWQYFVEVPPDAKVLDIGAGWGTISIPLARNYDFVVALDGTNDRLEFLRVRAEQEGIKNIMAINSDIFSHPFEMEQFDLVVFNGVLEWVAVGSEYNEPPSSIQKRALDIALKLLKPGGYLYIGIENSLGIKYFIGIPDDHTNINDITFLDRNEANKISEKLTGSEYRTYTYNRDGYEEMLMSVGFVDINFYYPIPDYKQIDSINNLKDDNVNRYINKKMKYMSRKQSIHSNVINLEKTLIDMNMLDQFVSSYSIVCRKKGW